MSLIRIAWRSIWQRALASGMTAFAMGLGVALVVTVLVIHSVIEQSFMRGTIGCNYIVGGKGSQYQLVLNTIFHVEQPLGNIPYKYMEELQNRYSPIIETMVPLCMGHDYKTYPALATTSDYFDKLTYKDGVKFVIAEGRNIQDANPYEAVIGSRTAQWLKLKIGDTIAPTAGNDGKGAAAHKDSDFTIVGILAPTGTANDRSVFLNIEGFWQCPSHGGKPASAASTDAKPKKTDAPKDAADGHQHEPADDPKHDPHAEHEHDADGDQQHEAKDGPKPEAIEEHKHDAADEHKHEAADEHKDATAGAEHVHDENCDHDHEADRQVSAFLIRTKADSDDPNVVAMTAKISALMEREISKGPVAQAVSPSRVLVTLLETMVGKIQMILLILAVLVVVEAGISIMVSMYNSMSDRKHDIAIMRALGASRFTVMSIILLESILLSLGGGLFGLLVGHGMVGILSPVVAEQSGVLISWLDFQPIELILIPGLVVLATLVGYLPAMYAYKTDVAKSLMAGT